MEKKVFDRMMKNICNGSTQDLQKEVKRLFTSGALDTAAAPPWTILFNVALKNIADRNFTLRTQAHVRAARNLGRF